MIRVNPKPPVAWAFAFLAVTLAVSAFFWQLRFMGTLWGLPSGNVRELTAGYGIKCAGPWEPFDVFGCRQMFIDIGYQDIPKVVRYQMSVTAPWVVGLGVLIAALWNRYLTRPWTYLVSGFGVGDHRDLQRALKAETGSKTVELFPDAAITKKREVRSIAVIGATGSGKSSVMLWLAMSVTKRGDPCIIFCYKDEWLRWLTVGSNPAYILLAPHDRRSAIWAVALDVFDEASAIRLAQYLIPLAEGDHKFFSEAARSICTAMVMKLMREKGQSWGWGDLQDEIEKPLSHMIEVTKTFYPLAANFADVDPRQAQSTYATLLTHLINVRLLGLAWRDDGKRPRFSVRDYVINRGRGLPQHLFLLHSGDFEQMSFSWISLFFEMAADAVRSESMKEADEQPVWFFMDEFAQLPKIKGMDTLLMTGRSKSVPVVLGAQSLSQIYKTYGKETSETWISSIGTKLFGRHEIGPGAHAAAAMFGKSRVREKKPTPHANGGSWDPGEYREAEPFTAHDFATELKVRDRRWYHPRSFLGTSDHLITGIGSVLCKVAVPFSPRVEHRDGYVEAAWISEGRNLMIERQRILDGIEQGDDIGDDEFWKNAAE